MRIALSFTMAMLGVWFNVPILSPCYKPLEFRLEWDTSYASGWPDGDYEVVASEYYNNVELT
jgi:hypothetical protein